MAEHRDVGFKPETDSKKNQQAALCVVSFPNWWFSNHDVGEVKICRSTPDKITYVVYCKCTVWPGTQQITGETNQVVSTSPAALPGAMTTIFFLKHVQ